MRELVDILLVVCVLSVALSLLLATYVLIACLLKSRDLSQRFFSSRRFLPFRVLRFFSKRRYVDTADPTLVQLGSATIYLGRASVFFTGITVMLLALAGP